MSKLTATIHAPGQPVISVELDATVLVIDKVKELGLPTDNIKINGLALVEGQKLEQGDTVSALGTKNVTGNI